MTPPRRFIERTKFKNNKQHAWKILNQVQDDNMIFPGAWGNMDSCTGEEIYNGGNGPTPSAGTV